MSWIAMLLHISFKSASLLVFRMIFHKIIWFSLFELWMSSLTLEDTCFFIYVKQSSSQHQINSPSAVESNDLNGLCPPQGVLGMLPVSSLPPPPYKNFSHEYVANSRRSWGRGIPAKTMWSLFLLICRSKNLSCWKSGIEMRKNHEC